MSAWRRDGRLWILTGADGRSVSIDHNGEEYVTTAGQRLGKVWDEAKRTAESLLEPRAPALRSNQPRKGRK